VHSAKPKVVRTHKRPKKKKVTHVAVTPKPTKPVTTTPVVPAGEVAGVDITTTARDPARRALVIAGIGLAGLLFLLVVTVPATAVRFTAPGRVVMDHQTDLVLTGVALLLLTLLLLYVTGTGA
jgi:hypothetical protein